MLTAVDKPIMVFGRRGRATTTAIQPAFATPGLDDPTDSCLTAGPTSSLTGLLRLLDNAPDNGARGSRTGQAQTMDWEAVIRRALRNALQLTSLHAPPIAHLFQHALVRGGAQDTFVVASQNPVLTVRGWLRWEHCKRDGRNS